MIGGRTSRRALKTSACTYRWYKTCVGSAGEAARHAGGLYGTAFRRLRHPVNKVEEEAHHLHQVEMEGESGETPFIAILGLLFFLVPIGIVMGLLAFGAAWLFG
jgi:hypothetical protein